MKNPVAEIITTKGTIKAELFPNEAPNSAASFIWCANQGFYNNRRIRRVEPDFVIEPSYTHFDESRCDFYLDGEFDKNGKANTVRLENFSLALSGDGKTESHGCEFFIILSDKAGQRLQGEYAGFGKIIEGFDVVKQLCSVTLKDVFIEDMNFYVHEAVEEQNIIKVNIETFGESYDKPQIKYWAE